MGKLDELDSLVQCIDLELQVVDTILNLLEVLTRDGVPTVVTGP